MAYLKINGKKTHYAVTLAAFTSQHGYEAVRFIGEEVPQTDKGFKYYADDDTEIADLSRFTHYYRPNEYTAEEDIIEAPEGSNEPIGPSALDVMSRRISQLGSQVSAITPIVCTKHAYIGDTRCEFDAQGLPDGVITASVNAGGIYVPFILDRTATTIVVTFEELEEVAEVTISIL